MPVSGQFESVGKLYAIVIDVNELETCARFWSQVLAAEILFQDESYIRLGRKGERPTVLLQKVPERHTEKNRVHIDLDVSDLEGAARRVQDLGGQKIRHVSEYGIEWVVMADPDGNEFCLVKYAR